MSRYRQGLFAIAELFAVLIVGGVLGGLTVRIALGSVGIDLTTVDETALYAEPSYQGALIAAVTVGARFFWLLLIGFAVLRFVHGLTPRAAGVGRGGHPVSRLVGAGVLLFAVGSLPFKLFLLADRLWDFGEGIEGWRYFSDQSLTPAYVLLVAASLVVLPPLFEEPFARGYMRARLAMPFGSVGGVILAGVLFMMSHGHFYEPDGVVLATFAALIYGAICWTWSAYRMGSVVPALIAHVLTNLPLPVETAYLLPTVAAMTVILLVGRRVVRREAFAFASELRAAPTGPLVFGLALIASTLLTIVFVDGVAPLIGVVALVLAIVGWLPRFRRPDSEAPKDPHPGEEPPTS